MTIRKAILTAKEDKERGIGPFAYFGLTDADKEFTRRYLRAWRSINPQH